MNTLHSPIHFGIGGLDCHVTCTTMEYISCPLYIDVTPLFS